MCACVCVYIKLYAYTIIHTPESRNAVSGSHLKTYPREYYSWKLVSFCRWVRSRVYLGRIYVYAAETLSLFPFLTLDVFLWSILVELYFNLSSICVYWLEMIEFLLGFSRMCCICVYRLEMIELLL